MKHFDVENIPQGFLRARFRTVSLEQTEKLAEYLVPVLKTTIDKTSPNEKVGIGLEGDPLSGKTPVAKKLISKLSHKTIDTREFSKLFAIADDKVGWHYDTEGFDDFNRETMEAAERLRNIASKASFEIIEWPHKEMLNILLSFSYDNQIELEEDSPREIDFYCTKEIFEMPEYPEFIRNAAKEGLLVEEISP